MNKVIFLDRDGVINRDPGEKIYVTSIKDFKFIPGVIKAVRGLSFAGYKIFIISNQQGVAKNILSEATLNEITKQMRQNFEKEGAEIAGIYYCTHLKEESCGCRKPKPGLIKKAVKGLKVDLKDSFFIGDTESDIKTGKAAGCKTILVLSGKTKNRNVECWQAKPDYIVNDLKEAADFILNRSLR
ncbi:MAG: D-glycero-beta-D-manno-heptose 1,7-bisphosphate 7-phosphatase [Candidatus Omnitrophota bacterium]